MAVPSSAANSTNNKRKYEDEDPIMKKMLEAMQQGEKVMETAGRKPLSWLLDLHEQGRIENYKNQRVSCWCESDQREYIEKSFEREHNPVMLIRCTVGKSVPYEIGDGGNRATAFLNFAHDRFPIHVTNDKGDKVDVYYSQLDDATKFAWRMHTDISLLQLRNISDEKFEERVCFC